MWRLAIYTTARKWKFAHELKKITTQAIYAHQHPSRNMMHIRASLKAKSSFNKRSSYILYFNNRIQCTFEQFLGHLWSSRHILWLQHNNSVYALNVYTFFVHRFSHKSTSEIEFVQIRDDLILTGAVGCVFMP